MAYPAAHSYLTVLGDAYSSAEIWQTGFRLSGTDSPTEAEFEALNTAVQAFLSTPSLRFPAGHRYLGLKWAPQDTDGKYGANGESVEWFRPTAFNQSVNTGLPQIALVVSLRTARARGYGSNGRNYWPSDAQPSGTDGMIPLEEATNVRNAGATLIAAINAVDLGDVVVGSTVGSGRLEPVTGVRVGRVMDTQRRRRNQLTEQYTAEATVPS